MKLINTSYNERSDMRRVDKLKRKVDTEMERMPSCPLKNDECKGTECGWYVNNGLERGCALAIIARRICKVRERGDLSGGRD